MATIHTARAARGARPERRTPAVELEVWWRYLRWIFLADRGRRRQRVWAGDGTVTNYGWRMTFRFRFACGCSQKKGPVLEKFVYQCAGLGREQRCARHGAPEIRRTVRKVDGPHGSPIGTLVAVPCPGLLGIGRVHFQCPHLCPVHYPSRYTPLGSKIYFQGGVSSQEDR